jgi:eukaryotic-like serine/threonine-protein kinase
MGDPFNRTISPFSKVTVSQYIENRFNENNLESLVEVEKLANGDPTIVHQISEARRLIEAATQATELEAQARTLIAQGKLKEAESQLREVLATCRRLWTNDPAKWESSLSSLVEVLRREGKYLEGEQLFNEVLKPSVEKMQQSARLLRSRADFRARQGRWEEAGVDSAKALEFQPSDHVPYHMLAPLYVAGGNLEGYRRVCQQILTQFSGTTDPFVADRMAKDCLILLSSGADLQAVGKLAQTAVRVGTNQSALPYFQCTEALSDYRQDRFGSAVDLAQKSIDNPSFSADHNRFVEAYMVLAMSQFRLQHKSEANTALAKGQEIANKMAKLESGDIGSGWRDWIIARALLKEATSLIKGAREH